MKKTLIKRYELEKMDNQREQRLNKENISPELRLNVVENPLYQPPSTSRSTPTTPASQTRPALLRVPGIANDATILKRGSTATTVVMTSSSESEGDISGKRVPTQAKLMRTISSTEENETDGKTVKMEIKTETTGRSEENRMEAKPEIADAKEKSNLEKILEEDNEAQATLPDALYLRALKMSKRSFLEFLIDQKKDVRHAWTLTAMMANSTRRFGDVPDTLRKHHKQVAEATHVRVENLSSEIHDLELQLARTQRYPEEQMELQVKQCHVPFLREAQIDQTTTTYKLPTQEFMVDRCGVYEHKEEDTDLHFILRRVMKYAEATNATYNDVANLIPMVLRGKPFRLYESKINRRPPGMKWTQYQLQVLVRELCNEFNRPSCWYPNTIELELTNDKARECSLDRRIAKILQIMDAYTAKTDDGESVALTILDVIARELPPAAQFHLREVRNEIVDADMAPSAEATAYAAYRTAQRAERRTNSTPQRNEEGNSLQKLLK